MKEARIAFKPAYARVRWVKENLRWRTVVGCRIPVLDRLESSLLWLTVNAWYSAYCIARTVRVDCEFSRMVVLVESGSSAVLECYGERFKL